MNDLLLDPFIVSIRGDASASDATQFVERAIMWSRAEARTGCRIATSNRYLSSLWQENEYPTPDKIYMLFHRTGVERYAPDTVIRAIDGLLSISPKVEEVLGVDEVLVDSAEVTVLPAVLLARLPPQVACALVESLALCAIYNNISGSQYPIGLASACCSTNREDILRCNLLIMDCESSQPIALLFPRKLVLECQILESIEDVFRILEFSNVRQNVERSIEWSWVRIVPPQERDARPLRRFTIRSEFRRSIVGLNPDENLMQQLYRKVACLLCGLDMAGLEIEPLRIDRGANSEQLIRGKDGAKAFRMQISQYGPGYHVHYWEVPGQHVELASFSTHNDFHIPE